MFISSLYVFVFIYVNKYKVSITTFIMDHYTESYSKNNYKWQTGKPPGQYVGGTFVVSNTSHGYHELLKQWWDHYFTSGKVLIVSENSIVKSEFKNVYPLWDIKTTDFYDTTTDIFADICNKQNQITEKFDLIINQATLEHVYNPFQAMENLCDSLNKDGILVTHTHPPNMGYHQYPRDYFRFMKDWWYDLPKLIPNIELVEFHMHENFDVFTLYRKTA